jgi:urea transport system substrate-binding protein
MAISETALKETALMTIDEINAKGGVLGKKLEPVVVDPASNWPLFAEKARQLLTKDKVAVTFGCWTSVSRKSVLPVFKELNGLLFYPVQYEGEELEKNVFYTGAAPNQQAIPAVEYLMSRTAARQALGLLGTDYVYPRTTNKILRAFLKSKGVADADIMEEYTPFGHSDYQTIIAKIKKFAGEGKKTAVVSTINGDSNVPFYKELGNAGLKATDVPVVAFSVGEEELRGVDTKPLVGHLAAWNYFQSIKNPGERQVHQDVPRLGQEAEAAQGRHGRHQRPDGSHLHRHPHVEAGGREGQVHRCRQGHRRHGRPDLQGAVRLHHQDGREEPPPAQAVFIGEVKADGQFNVVWKTKGPVKAQPWSPSLPATTRRRTSRKGKFHRPVARLHPAAGRAGPGHHLRRDGRDQHGARRTADDRRLCHLCVQRLFRSYFPDQLDWYLLAACRWPSSPPPLSACCSNAR